MNDQTQLFQHCTAAAKVQAPYLLAQRADGLRETARKEVIFGGWADGSCSPAQQQIARNKGTWWKPSRNPERGGSKNLQRKPALAADTTVDGLTATRHVETHYRESQ